MQPHDPARGKMVIPVAWRVMRMLVLLAVLLLMVTAGCSRLSFIRPDMARGKFESTAHEVVITNHGRSAASSALDRVLLAQQRLASGELAQAEREARQALKLDPKSAASYTVLAIVQDRGGNARIAEQHYRRATELAPDQGGMLNNYGTWLCGNGRAAESLAWFDRALAAPGYPTPDLAAANAGACALQAGQTARGESMLRQALILDPQNQVGLSAMAELEFNAGRPLTARAFSQRRLAAAPADAAALLLASQIERKLGDSAAAEAYVRRLRAEFPDARSSEQGSR